MTNSTTNKGGLSRESFSPLPLKGGLVLLQACRECFLTVCLTRCFHGVVPDTMICTIQPNGLCMTAYLCGSSRRLAEEQDTRQKIIGTVPASFTKDVGMARTPHQLFSSYRSGQTNGKETCKGSSLQSLLQGSSHQSSRYDYFPRILMPQTRAPLDMLVHGEECSTPPAPVCER